MMDGLLSDHGAITLWLTHYGSFAIFGLLALGIIALPVPEETLLILTGILIAKDKLPWHSTFLAACAGSLCGITVSYLVGLTAGNYIFDKYGRWIGLTEVKHRRIHNWFERLGKWTLFFGYFIPGVRHFTGVTAGISYLHYKAFALFAYTGGIVWVSLFLSIGYFLGDYWTFLTEMVEESIEGIIIFCLGLIAVAIALKMYLKKR